jgi:hypothetical protein
LDFPDDYVFDEVGQGHPVLAGMSAWVLKSDVKAVAVAVGLSVGLSAVVAGDSYVFLPWDSDVNLLLGVQPSLKSVGFRKMSAHETGHAMALLADAYDQDVCDKDRMIENSETTIDTSGWKKYLKYPGKSPLAKTELGAEYAALMKWQMDVDSPTANDLEMALYAYRLGTATARSNWQYYKSFSISLGGICSWVEKSPVIADIRDRS